MSFHFRCCLSPHPTRYTSSSMIRSDENPCPDGQENHYKLDPTYKIVGKVRLELLQTGSSGHLLDKLKRWVFFSSVLFPHGVVGFHAGFLAVGLTLVLFLLQACCFMVCH